jgi:hypothetical protein
VDISEYFPKFEKLKKIVHKHGKILFSNLDQVGMKVNPMHIEIKKSVVNEKPNILESFCQSEINSLGQFRDILEISGRMKKTEIKDNKSKVPGATERF